MWVCQDSNLGPRHYQWRALTSWATRPLSNVPWYVTEYVTIFFGSCRERTSLRSLKPLGFGSSATGKLPFFRPLSRFDLVGRAGIEPATISLKGCCSTNWANDPIWKIKKQHKNYTACRYWVNPEDIWAVSSEYSSNYAKKWQLPFDKIFFGGARIDVSYSPVHFTFFRITVQEIWWNGTKSKRR